MTWFMLAGVIAGLLAPKVSALALHLNMPMQVLRIFHGEQLFGSFGTKFFEAAAHWAIVMFATGIFCGGCAGPRAALACLPHRMRHCPPV